MAQKKVKSYVVYRDSRTGQFVQKKVASRRPKSTVEERVPIVNPGATHPTTSRALRNIASRHDDSLRRLAKK